jgi:hypothetical protein
MPALFRKKSLLVFMTALHARRRARSDAQSRNSFNLNNTPHYFHNGTTVKKTLRLNPAELQHRERRERREMLIST